MSLLRRSIALVVLLAAVYVAYWTQSSSLGLASPILLVVSIVVALCALAILVFNLPIARLPSQEDGFDHSVLSERQGMVVGAVIIFLFGVALAFLAIRGVFKGSVAAPWSDFDIEFRQAPIRYLIALSFWLGLGSVFLWLSSRLFRLRHAEPSANEPGDA